MFYFCVVLIIEFDFVLLKQFDGKNLLFRPLFYPDLPVPPNIFVQSFTCGVLVCLLHNFRLQMIFVSKNISVPFGNSLVFTNPNFVSHLKKSQKWKIISLTKFLVWFFRSIRILRGPSRTADSTYYFNLGKYADPAFEFSSNFLMKFSASLRQVKWLI